jgi:hypothetical protein
MRLGDLASALHPRQTDVLDLVTGWTESDHPDQALDASRAVVLPDLVALDRMPRSPLSADLASTAGMLVDL